MTLATLPTPAPRRDDTRTRTLIQPGLEIPPRRRRLRAYDQEPETLADQMTRLQYTLFKLFFPLMIDR